jgi:cell fate (sporulation/competence/biofilm development) regulator YmcA (YheA/YmcA/DUF963 family)
MQTPTRPFEQICFFPIEFPTTEGDVYIYAFVDSYSRYLTMTSIEKNNHTSTILEHIKAFTKNELFLKHSDGQAFTLIVHKYQDMLNDINQILAPFNGSVHISDPLVAQIMEPVIKDIYENFNNKKPDR